MRRRDLIDELDHRTARATASLVWALGNAITSAGDAVTELGYRSIDAACKRSEHRFAQDLADEELELGDTITVGVDLGQVGDATAIVTRPERCPCGLAFVTGCYCGNAQAIAAATRAGIVDHTEPAWPRPR